MYPFRLFTVNVKVSLPPRLSVLISLKLFNSALFHPIFSEIPARESFLPTYIHTYEATRLRFCTAHTSSHTLQYITHFYNYIFHLWHAGIKRNKITASIQENKKAAYIRLKGFKGTNLQALSTCARALICRRIVFLVFIGYITEKF